MPKLDAIGVVSSDLELGEGWGQRYAQLRDPDGVPVDLFAAL